MDMLPHVVRVVAPALPTFHLAQLMYASFGATAQGSLMTHLVSLLGFTLLMLGIAWIAFSRREQNSLAKKATAEKIASTAASSSIGRIAIIGLTPANLCSVISIQ